MQTVYYLIAAAGLTTFYTHAFTNSFRGSVLWVKTLFEFIAGIGFLSFHALIIALFFKTTWWHPLLLYVAVSAVAGFTSRLGHLFIIGALSLFGVIVFNILSWTTLF